MVTSQERKDSKRRGWVNKSPLAYGWRESSEDAITRSIGTAFRIWEKAYLLSSFSSARAGMNDAQ